MCATHFRRETTLGANNRLLLLLVLGSVACSLLFSPSLVVALAGDDESPFARGDGTTPPIDSRAEKAANEKRSVFHTAEQETIASLTKTEKIAMRTPKKKRSFPTIQHTLGYVLPHNEHTYARGRKLSLQYANAVFTEISPVWYTIRQEKNVPPSDDPQDHRSGSQRDSQQRMGIQKEGNPFVVSGDHYYNGSWCHALKSKGVAFLPSFELDFDVSSIRRIIDSESEIEEIADLIALVIERHVEVQEAGKEEVTPPTSTTPTSHQRCTFDGIVLRWLSDYPYSTTGVKAATSRFLQTIRSRVESSIRKDARVKRKPRFVLGVQADYMSIAAKEMEWLKDEVTYLSVHTDTYPTFSEMKFKGLAPLEWMSAVVAELDAEPFSTFFTIPFSGMYTTEKAIGEVFTGVSRSTWMAMARTAQQKGQELTWEGGEVAEHSLRMYQKGDGHLHLWYPTRAFVLHRLSLLKKVKQFVAVWDVGAGMDQLLHQF